MSTMRLSHPIKIKSMQAGKPVGAVLTGVGGMAFHRLAEFFAPAVANWISRVFGGATIFAIFAGAMPSLITWSLWSLERLTSHSVQANSCCSKIHSQKHTVRTQKRSHMLEEMESEKPLVWSCLLIDMNGNILYWEAENVSFVQVKSGDGLLLLPTCKKANARQRGGNRRWSTRWIYTYTIVYSYMYVLQKMIIWQLSHIMQTVLVIAKWIIADCMTSSGLWVNLCSPCKHESELLSRCFKCPPCACRIPSKSKWCKPVGAVLTDFFAPAVANWISRVFGETIISVIFARAIAMWPSHLIEWSPERLTSQRCMSVTAVLTTIGMVPNRLHSLF